MFEVAAESVADREAHKCSLRVLGTDSQTESLLVGLPTPSTQSAISNLHIQINTPFQIGIDFWRIWI